MDILKKYKNNKKYNKLTFISILLVALFSLSTIISLTAAKMSLDLKVIEVKLKLTEEDIAIGEKTLKENPDLSRKEIFVDYSETIKTKNELTEEIKSKKEELKNSEKIWNLSLIFTILMTIILFFSKYMNKKTKVKKEDYIELLKEDNSFEKEVIEYLDIDSIENLLSDINYLKEFQELVNEKDWLIKRIKKENKFKDLLNNIHFKEYLSLFDDDYINNYFKEEINKIKEDLEIINKISKENVLSEKESFRIIKM